MTEALPYWLAVVVVTLLAGWLAWYGWRPPKGRHRGPRQPRKERTK